MAGRQAMLVLPTLVLASAAANLPNQMDGSRRRSHRCYMASGAQAGGPKQVEHHGVLFGTLRLWPPPASGLFFSSVPFRPSHRSRTCCYRLVCVTYPARQFILCMLSASVVTRSINTSSYCGF